MKTEKPTLYLRRKDELQEFPEIVTGFKFLAQDGRFDVIASGSMLGIQVRRVKSFSVGYQETATMRSLDFEEFLWACGYTAEQIDRPKQQEEKYEQR